LSLSAYEVLVVTVCLLGLGPHGSQLVLLKGLSFQTVVISDWQVAII